ncbi:MAG: hypothetical protein NC081_05445 [Roseburia sp.]|nr:hypothetical protein [Lachnospiraceae bacterium]MCM1568877.1 hypothetical protein [Roseburia sp.]
MAYSDVEKAQCDAIMEAFKPYLDGHAVHGKPYFDIVYSEKFGMYLDICNPSQTDNPSWTDMSWLRTPQEMLEAFLIEICDDVIFRRAVSHDVEKRRSECMQTINAALSRMDDKNRALWEPVAVGYIETVDFYKDLHE